MVGPTINQARDTRQAAATIYYTALGKYRQDPEDTRIAEKVLKARREWGEAQEEWDRAQRRANWIRAKRIITLAAHGRGQHEAIRFLADDFKVVR